MKKGTQIRNIHTGEIRTIVSTNTLDPKSVIGSDNEPNNLREKLQNLNPIKYTVFSTSWYARE